MLLWAKANKGLSELNMCSLARTIKLQRFLLQLLFNITFGVDPQSDQFSKVTERTDVTHNQELEKKTTFDSFDYFFFYHFFPSFFFSFTALQVYA